MLIFQGVYSFFLCTSKLLNLYGVTTIQIDEQLLGLGRHRFHTWHFPKSYGLCWYGSDGLLSNGCMKHKPVVPKWCWFSVHPLANNHAATQKQKHLTNSYKFQGKLVHFISLRLPQVTIRYPRDAWNWHIYIYIKPKQNHNWATLGTFQHMPR